MLRVQEAAKLPDELGLVTVAGGQLLLTGLSGCFLRWARWEGDIATGWRLADEASTVLIDPGVRFGRPSVGGISTEVIWEPPRTGKATMRSPASSA